MVIDKNGEVEFRWTAKELDGEIDLSVVVRRVGQGLQFVFPRFGKKEGADGVPVWLDLLPFAQDGLSPVQFVFHKDNGGEDEPLTKTLLFADGDVEVVARADMAVGDPDAAHEFGIAVNDHVLFAPDGTE